LITLGKNWRVAIAEAIKQADVFVYLHSDVAAASDEVRKEIELALDAPNKKRPAFISILNPNEQFPQVKPFTRLNDAQFLQLTDTNRVADLRRLITDIHKTIVERNVT